MIHPACLALFLPLYSCPPCRCTTTHIVPPPSTTPSLHYPPQPHALLPFPDLMYPAGAFQLTPSPPGFDPRGVIRVESVYQAGLDLPQLVGVVRAAVERHLARTAAAFPSLQLDQLLLELPCTFFSLRTAK